jgi:hypothetical protein
MRSLFGLAVALCATSATAYTPTSERRIVGRTQNDDGDFSSFSMSLGLSINVTTVLSSQYGNAQSPKQRLAVACMTAQQAIGMTKVQSNGNNGSIAYEHW